MATLQQTLKGLPQADDQMTRGPGGVLQQKKTLQQATQQLGLSAAPTTPLGAELAGAGPQPAKMAGTPQQLQAALQQASEPSDLQTTLRRKQFTREATAGEAAAIQKSADMQKLGGLGDRVTKLITSEYEKIPVAPTNLLAVDEYQGKKLGPIADKLAAVIKNPNDMDAQLAVAEYFGRALDPTEIKSLFKSTGESLGTAAAGAVRNLSAVPITEMLTDLGYDLPTLSGLLGIPVETLQKYSVEQVQEKVDQVAAEEYSKAQQIQQQAASPFAGAAERAQAREAGRELATTGVRATEADMQRLADTIESADQVSFLGQTKSYKDWLADDEISAMIKEVVDSPEGSQLRKDLEQMSPDLYNFVTNNEASLKNLTSQIETGASQFKQLQDKNKEFISNTFGNIDLDPTLQEELIPGSTKLSATELTSKSSPVTKYLTDKTPDQRKQFTNQINSARTDNPNIGKEIASLSPEKLKTLAIESNGKRWRDYVYTLNDSTDIKNTDPLDSDKLLSHFSTSISNVKQVEDDINTQRALDLIGIPDSTYTTGSIPLKDGKVNTEQLKPTLLAGTPVPKLEDAADGKMKSVEFTYKSPKLPGTDTAPGRIYDTFSDILKTGRVPTIPEIQQAMITDSTGRIMSDLNDSGITQKWGYKPEDLLFKIDIPNIDWNKLNNIDLSNLDIGLNSRNVPGIDIRL